MAAAAAIMTFAYGAYAQKAPEKAAPKAKSACNSKADETACKADATCSWVAALTDSKTGKQKRKAYCRTKPKPPAKKAADAPKK
jgi:hypothetical protein